MSKHIRLFLTAILTAIVLIGLVSFYRPVLVSAEELPPSAGDGSELLPPDRDPETLFQTPVVKPSDQHFEEKSLLKDDVNASLKRYMSWGGLGLSTFNTNYYLAGPNCLVNAESDGRLAHQTVNIPDGSKIVYMDFSGADKSPTEETYIYLAQYPWDGRPGTTIATIHSGKPYSAGNFTESIDIPNWTVENYANSYRISVRFPPYVNTEEVSFCQVTIGYIPPSPFAVAAPLILK